MFEALSLAFAFAFGLLARRIGLPPLVGFLLAGFALHLSDREWGLMPEGGASALGHLAHAGVLLLLFTVGLKLKLGQVVKPAVFGGGLLHGALTLLMFVPVLAWMGVSGKEAWLVAVALSFSSTVLAAKMLEAKRELSAFYGRIAIGILILQDLIALAALVLWGGRAPEPWAALVLLLPFLRPLFWRLLDFCGHDELLVLMGMLLALVLGGLGFQVLGLSGELGALAMGVLLGGHARSRELSDALWGMKELFLVAFFLQIGMSGLPSRDDWEIALVLLLLLPLKGLLFFGLLVAFKLRARSAFLAALSLTAYSEFGLIVAAGIPGLSEWLVPLALALSLSFVLAAPLNRAASALFERWEPWLQRAQRAQRLPDEEAPDLAGAGALVFGMGRTGTAAFHGLLGHFPRVVGVDADPYRVAEHRAASRRVVMADAEDVDFWRHASLDGLSIAVLAMDDLDAKLAAARQLRANGFTGPIVTHALYADHAALLHAAGADGAHLTMHEAGRQLAEEALRRLAEPGFVDRDDESR